MPSSLPPPSSAPCGWPRLLEEEVACLMEVRDLGLKHVKLFALRPLGSFGVFEDRALLGFLALLRDNELGIVGALRGSIIHLLLVILLGLLLVALRLGKILLHVADHVVDHCDDAGTGLALLVFPERLGRRSRLTSGNLSEEVILLLLRRLFI